MDTLTTTTTPTMALDAPASTKRCAIIGTASTWKLAPWNDLSVDILGLNDAYVLGIPRATYWFDLHPFSQMAFRPKGQRLVSVFDVPIGAYLRPEGHLDWLKSRAFPVYLSDARPDWPHSRTFPRADIEAKYGKYFASTPAWMLAWAIEEGYREIQIYGIHLATQWEYLQQRPNLEWLLGIALQRGISLVIPNKSPLLKNKWCYAYEPKPDIPMEGLQRKIDGIKLRGKDLHERLAHVPWYAHAQRLDLEGQLTVANLELKDAQTELAHVSQLYQVA